jgi:AcrR family transcriptional regulator
LPQRSNGKLRVAAILEAAAAVIAEKSYEGATMAEIAARSGTKIGSLYRFFPNKESLADTIVVNAHENIKVLFDKIDADANTLSVRALTDRLLDLVFRIFTRPALMQLLDASEGWSVKREQFRSEMQQRTAKTLTIHSPSLPTKSAETAALVVLLNAKAMATHQKFVDSAPSILDEFRDMTWLYLESRLGSPTFEKSCAS